MENHGNHGIWVELDRVMECHGIRTQNFFDFLDYKKHKIHSIPQSCERKIACGAFQTPNFVLEYTLYLLPFIRHGIFAAKLVKHLFTFGACNFLWPRGFGFVVLIWEILTLCAFIIWHFGNTKLYFIIPILCLVLVSFKQWPINCFKLNESWFSTFQGIPQEKKPLQPKNIFAVF